MRTFAKILGLFAAVLVAFAAAAAWQYRDLPASELEARYGTPPSQYIEIEGVRFHVRDEGQGPGVLLIHANWANMLDWDPWVRALEDQYRVVRFDMPGFGLTGPDPTGDYSIERTVELVRKLTDALNLEEFVLAGASLGGTVGMHFSIAYPERVERLILVSPGALNPRVRGRMEPPNIPAVFNILTVITPEAIPRAILRSGFGDETRITDELATRWHELLLREGNRMAQLERQRQYVSGDVDALIGRVSVPVLLMWGALNKQVPVTLVDEMTALLQSAPSIDKMIYPAAGHQLAQEIGEQTGGDVRRYLDEHRADPRIEAGT